MLRYNKVLESELSTEGSVLGKTKFNGPLWYVLGILKLELDWIKSLIKDTKQNWSIAKKFV